MLEFLGDHVLGLVVSLVLCVYLVYALIRAERFRPNPDTAADNAFQADAPVQLAQEAGLDQTRSERGQERAHVRARAQGCRRLGDRDAPFPGGSFPPALPFVAG